jgi:glycosyltransferase involved in cell wall biosynthesis
MSAQHPAGDLICFSHLRWDFVFQRPNHLMSHCARSRRVFYFEEPLLHDGAADLHITQTEHGVIRVVPLLPKHALPSEHLRDLGQLVDALLRTHCVERYSLWYYTPMALAFTRHLSPQLVVYDVMDELKNFKFAPPELHALEEELFARADVVFTGGRSLYEAKKPLHPDVHVFPSSVDVPHFARARRHRSDPLDQAPLPGPRLGFFGVIDERMNLDLVGALADLEPSWQLVMIGPVVKIDPKSLPRRANIHWLGGRPYAQLPDYISGWDVAIMPFALNDSTRFISPTKTPEFLAAGRPVVSTPVTDVVSPYGDLQLVRIASNSTGFVAAAKAAMQEDTSARWRRFDPFLAGMSWEMTWQRMERAMSAAQGRRGKASAARAA